MGNTFSKLCQIKELNLSCIGCCGHDFTGRKAVIEGIRKNTAEYRKVKTRSDLLKFRDKQHLLRHCGICTCLIFENSEITCPIHPKKLGEELRKDYCDIDHLCRPALEFNNLNWFKKRRFLKFIENKLNNGMDWYEYSILCDNGKLWEEFENNKI